MGLKLFYVGRMRACAVVLFSLTETFTNHDPTMVEVNVGIASVPRPNENVLIVCHQEKAVARTLLLTPPILPLCQSMAPLSHHATTYLRLLPRHLRQ